MKKLVIFSLIAVLVTGAVFAQEIDISGFFRVGADAINGHTAGTGDGTTQDRLNAGVTHTRGRLNFKAQNEEGTFGGFLRLQANNELSVGVALAWVWWQPVQLLKIQAGLLDDFYVDEIVNTFGGVAEDTKVYNSGTKFVTNHGWGRLQTGRILNPDYDPDHPLPYMWDSSGGGIVADPDYKGAEYINGQVPGPIDTYSFDDLVNDAFPPEFAGVPDGVGAALSIYPIEGLSINLGVPFGYNLWGEASIYGYNPGDWEYGAEVAYKHFLAQVQYDINNIGRVSLAFKGKMGAKRNVSLNRISGFGFYTSQIPNNMVGDLDYDMTDSGTLYLGFYLTAVENLRLNFGFAFPLPYTETVEAELMSPATNDYTDSGTLTLTTQDALKIGLGATFDLNDAFSIGARLGLAFGEVKKYSVSLPAALEAGIKAADASTSYDVKGNTLFGIQLLPSYDLGLLKVFLNCGLTITAFADNYHKVMNTPGLKRDDKVGFWVNPYVEKTMGGGSFFIGVDLYTHGAEVKEAKLNDEGTKYKFTYDDPVLNWRIPVGMRFVF